MMAHKSKGDRYLKRKKSRTASNLVVSPTTGVVVSPTHCRSSGFLPVLPLMPQAGQLHRCQDSNLSFQVARIRFRSALNDSSAYLGM